MSADKVFALPALEAAAVKRKSIVGAVSYFSRTILSYGIAIISALILSALLRPEDFGVFGLVNQIIALLVFFSDIGLAATLIQKKESPTDEEYKTAFTLQQILSWLIFLLTVSLAWSGVVAQKTGPVGNYILISLGLSFPLASIKTIPSLILERKLEFSKLIIPQLVEQLFYNVTLVTAALLGYGAFSFVPAILMRSFSGVIAMMFIQRWQLKIGIARSALRSLLGYGVKFQLNDFLARIKDQLFYLALGYYLPLAQFGYINWAKNWSSYPYNLTVQNVMSLSFPIFSRLQHDKNLLKRAIEKAIFFISLVIFPLLAGMSVFVYPLLAVFPVYAKWEPAAFSLIFFTLSIVGGAISTPLTNTLNAIGHISTTLKLMGFWTVLTWILTPVLIYLYGYNGVALAAFIISLTSFLPILFVKKIVDVQIVEQIWRQAVASVCLAGVGFFGLEYWSQGLVKLLLGMALSGFIYVVVMMVLGKNKVVLEFASLRNARK